MLRIAVVLVGCAACVVGSAVGQPAGLAFYDDLSLLPGLYPNVQSYYVSSYDRTGGNDDGFRGTYSQLYVDNNGERVIFDANGPGCVYNLWFTGNGMRLRWGKIRFYFDDDKAPRFECEAEELFSGQRPPFVRPLVADAFISSGGFSCAAPLPFAKRLKITTEKTVGFYNAYYQLYQDASLKSWTPEQDYSRLIDLFERCGSDPKPRSAKTSVVRKTISLAAASRGKSTEEELLSLDHEGTIQYLRINPLYPPDAYSLNHVHLRISYDRQETPSVDVPIGPFFGSGLGEADVRSLFVGMSSSGTYYCYLPMPFRKAIRMALQNRSYQSGGQFQVEIGYTDTCLKVPPPGRLGYFGAKYHNAWPIVEREDYVLFEGQGPGAIIGQVMTVEPVHPDRKRWWEGDMRVTLDGEPKPRFHGTGHEDEYQGGWSTFWLMNPYSLPLFGEPKTQGLVDVFGQVNGSTTAYRFWPGKIPYAKSIRISTEHGNQNDTPANYSSLAYYYFLP
ncbi:MAG: DUF2961 domain-containing protein [Planctomycetes bacterium]|nr:DUF2961 domain-containing protein [Planctomycetota bacterium]